jgi:hypothetical protein
VSVISLIREIITPVLFSELRESSVADETSLLGDGGMGLLLLLLYGSAGCIIAPDGGILS